jgi:hypothetical protein
MRHIQDRPGSIADYLKTPRQHRVLNAIAQRLLATLSPLARSAAIAVAAFGSGTCGSGRSLNAP